MFRLPRAKGGLFPESDDRIRPIYRQPYCAPLGANKIGPADKLTYFESFEMISSFMICCAF
jgi:hypothetical protein